MHTLQQSWKTDTFGIIIRHESRMYIIKYIMRIAFHCSIPAVILIKIGTNF